MHGKLRCLAVGDAADGLELPLHRAVVGGPACYHILHGRGRRGEIVFLAITVKGSIVEAQQPVVNEDNRGQQWRDETERGVHQRR